MGFVDGKVTFFSCSGSGAWTLESENWSEGGVREGGGVGTLPRSILNGVNTVGVQERELCFRLGSVLLIVGSSVVADDNPVVKEGLL